MQIRQVVETETEIRRDQRCIFPACLLPAFAAEVTVKCTGTLLSIGKPAAIELAKF